MALIVTPGTTDANSYATADDFTTYHDSGHSLPLVRDEFSSIDPADYEALLINATRFIDQSYRFIGRKTNYASQSLQWPRIWVHLEGLWANEANQYINVDTDEI